MKKTLSLLILPALLVFAVSCGGGHNITGGIKGADGAVVVYAYDLGGNETTDTIQTGNGKFVYDIPESLSDPVYIMVIPESDIYTSPDAEHYMPESKS